MPYSVQHLTLVSDCDLALAMATKEKAILNFKKLSDEFSSTKFMETSQEIDADLAAAELELAAITQILAGLPEGPVRDEYLDKQRRTDFKCYTLRARKQSHGVIALLGKEMELQRIIQELEEVDVFIAAIEAQREVLLAA